MDEWSGKIDMQHKNGQMMLQEYSSANKIDNGWIKINGSMDRQYSKHIMY